MDPVHRRADYRRARLRRAGVVNHAPTGRGSRPDCYASLARPYELVDAADFDDVVAGPAGGEDLVATVGDEDHLLQAHAAIAGATLAGLDGDDVAGLDLLGVVEGEGAADDGLLVGHADAVADLGDEEALLGLVAPGAGGQEAARGGGGAGAEI